MFAKIQERINKLLWVKQSAEGLLAQWKDFVANAKAAVEDIRKDGIGMDDLAKVGQHFDNLKEKASDIVADAKEKASDIVADAKDKAETIATDAKEKANSVVTAAEEEKQDIINDIKEAA